MMKIQLQLAAFIVHFDLILVYPYSENGYQFWNPSTSSAKNNLKEKKIFIKTLQNGVSESQHVFDAMKYELQKAQNMNIQKRNYYGRSNIFKNNVVRKRETGIQNYNYDRTHSTTSPPINLMDIGYDKSWEKFCDVTEILDDFPDYPHHDLRRIRILICKLKQLNKINQDTVPTFAAYKLCNMIRMSTDYFLEKLTEKFVDKDEDKKAELLAEPDKNVTSECYNKTMKAFGEKCMGPEHLCNRMFKDLLNRACVMPWLKTQSIIASINEVCEGKWISDQVDWDTLFYTIRYNE